ncbi:MAG: hypothetical protein JRI25_25135, partial [Deltaproteobacteria bacterium]|nr:hypothetical protein [Deltaproteobacteria bacterium]
MSIATPTTVSIVCSGASVGLPKGGEEVFGHDNVARILEDRSQGIPLAGVRSTFDVTEYGVSPDLERALDITTRLALAAGIEALRDAGIPLVRRREAPGWGLPVALRDRTGVLFASAFPGYEELIEKLGAGGDDGEGPLDRSFLLQVLAMGHARFATAQAICIAEDWIGAGRCDRVVVIAADHITSGGAEGLVLERAEDCQVRGVVPIAELVGSVTANCASHDGSRMDPGHVSDCMQAVLQRAARREKLPPSEMASVTLHMSQETGHATGAGIDDVVALKALQYGRIPPVRVSDEPPGDPGHSGAERRDIQYAVCLSEGFGAQIAILVWKRIAFGDARVPEPKQRVAWLKDVTGYPYVDEFVEQRTLRVAKSTVDGLLPLPSAFPPDDVTTQETPLPPELRLGTPSQETLAPPLDRLVSSISESAPTATRPPTRVEIRETDILGELLAVIARETRYPITDLGPGLALEADLGIDA